MVDIAHVKALVLGLPPIIKAGIVRPFSPDKLVRAFIGMYRIGVTPGGLINLAAVRSPNQPAIIDDRGTITYKELNESGKALARALASDGLKERSKVGILARNHRIFPQLTSASAWLGSDVVMMNTGASTQQLLAVISEQKLDALIIDEEFTALIPQDYSGPQIYVSWIDTDRSIVRPGWKVVEEIIAANPQASLPTRPRKGATIILTSGTTGTPKGAKRPEPKDYLPASALTSKFPLKSAKGLMLSAPVFHTWGHGVLQIALALRATIIFRRKFDPKDALETLHRTQPESWFVVPTMLQRVLELELPDSEYKIPSLRILAASGSAITTRTVQEALQKFGPVLYNFYGTTEVAWASIATPDELAKYPTTAGRAPFGTTIKLYEEETATEVPQGEIGRLFIGNGFEFEGYTGGTKDKERINGLVNTGDLAHYNDEGLLFIDGRIDDMIVSGGENIYPSEVEDVLGNLPEIVESAVIGVDDDKFGKSLVAYVVLHEGYELSLEQIREYVKENLNKFSAPRQIVYLDELPRNATGKVVPRLLPPPPIVAEKK